MKSRSQKFTTTGLAAGSLLIIFFIWIHQSGIIIQQAHTSTSLFFLTLSLLALGVLTRTTEANGQCATPRAKKNYTINVESITQPIPYTFKHNGKVYDTSKAFFLGAFQDLGGQHWSYSYHVDWETREAFRIEWKNLYDPNLYDTTYANPSLYFSGYDVWYDGPEGYQYAVEDVQDRCGGEAANRIEENLATLFG